MFVTTFKVLPNIVQTHLPSRFLRASFSGVAVDVEQSYHVPVMMKECLEYLRVEPGRVFVDCTLGGGGHTKEILSKGGRVIGIDQDPDAIQFATQRLEKEIVSGQFEAVQSNFRNIVTAVRSTKLLHTLTDSKVDGILMDLGVSSFQIDEPLRGFSFDRDGPLDMRMNKGESAFVTTTTTSTTPYAINAVDANTIVNTLDVTHLADILYRYGDEGRSRQIAREIVSARPISTTGQLRAAVAGNLNGKIRSKTLSKCFQAIRIAVNDELGALEALLGDMHLILKPGGRVVVLSYHSLEDRIVKQFLKSNKNKGHIDSNSHQQPQWTILTKRPEAASTEEVGQNSRARSAKLRAAELH